MSAWKKLSVCFLTLVLWIVIMAMPVFAATASQDGLDVSLTTDKDSYRLDETIVATLSATNTSDSVISNVSLENLIPEGYKLADGSEADKKVDSLAPGETVSQTVELAADTSGSTGTTSDTTADGSQTAAKASKTPGTGTDNDAGLWIGLAALSCCLILAIILKKKKVYRRMLSLFLCITLTGALFAGIPSKAYAEDNQRNIDIKTSVTVDNADLEIQGVVKYDKTSGSSDGITLSNFAADETYFITNDESTITFTVNVQGTPDKVELIRDRAEVIGTMHDDGLDGDITADDGIFTYVQTLTVNESKNFVYNAKAENIDSDVVNIYFFSEPTQEDINEYTGVQAKLDEIESEFTDEEGYVPSENISAAISKASDYLKGLYDSKSLILCETCESSVSIKFNSGLTMIYTPKTKDTLSSAADAGMSLSTYQPFYSEVINVDYLKPYIMMSDTAARNVTDTFSNITFSDKYKDKEVTFECIKEFHSNQIILWTGHGIYSSAWHSAIQINKAYIACLFSNWKDCTQNRIVGGNKNFAGITSKFVDKYCGNMDNNFVYLNACYSAKDDVLAQSFIRKGAKAVVGNTNLISVIYASWIESKVLNLMATVNSNTGNYFTLGEALAGAKAQYGYEDPGTPGTRTIFIGSEAKNYRFGNTPTAQSGTLSGKICRASDRSTAVGGAAISVYKNDSLYTTKTADDSGNYNIALPAGEYRVEITADGYIPFTAYAAVTENNNYYMETFLLIQGTEGETGIASGKITDAVTGAGVDSAALTIRKGWNNTEHGAVVEAAATGSDGTYSASLPIGNYTMYVEKDGYISTGINIIVQPGTTGDQNGSITPVVTGDNSRIVLTWSINPRDLDSHVEGTLTNGSPFHVYYMYKSQYDGEIEVCNLDFDDTTSYGPETITLNPTTDKPYYYYVKKYAGSGTVASSEAQIKMYQNGSLVRTFNVPTNLGDGDYWNVFAIKDGQLIINNTITSSPDTSYAN